MYTYGVTQFNGDVMIRTHAHMPHRFAQYPYCIAIDKIHSEVATAVIGTQTSPGAAMSIGQRSKVNYEQLHYKKLYSAMAQAEAELEAGMIRGEKRKDYWSWEQFYMSVAFLSSKRSRDPNTEDRVRMYIHLFNITAHELPTSLFY